MQKLSFNETFLSQWIDNNKINNFRTAAAEAEKLLIKKNGPGNDFLGWLRLPLETSTKDLDSIVDKANEIRSNSDVLIAIGIGGSYLGAKASIEFLSNSFEDQRKPRVIFAGHQVNSDYLNDLIDLIKDKEVSVNVISKSGTTTEPGITFRVLRKFLENKYGKQKAAQRIVATTDPAKGALRGLAESEGYATFPVAPDIGGRFSVLSPAGLFPIAAAGINIKALIKGAKEAMKFCSGTDLDKNIAARYAVMRNILYRQGKTLEVMAGCQPCLHYISEWWKQLAGESEGKNQSGIFPASVDYTTDLHSLGQWMQEGNRTVFETFMYIKESRNSVPVPKFTDNSDELNYLAGKSFEEINYQAYLGTILAHVDGGVPASTLVLEDRSEETLGQLFYFFEKAIALSGYMLRVNPFDQPGVEAYKKNMFALLNKPGFQKMHKDITVKLKSLKLDK